MKFLNFFSFGGNFRPSGSTDLIESGSENTINVMLYCVCYRVFNSVKQEPRGLCAWPDLVYF